MPVAEEACKWLVNEALPHIRKAYATPHSTFDRFRQFIKSLRKQPETVPAKEAHDE
jgi:prophage antirepressor-like protein